METMKPEFLDSFFEQIESQVQFGDNKASYDNFCMKAAVDRKRSRVF
jgi:hypothetical protein